MATRGRREGGYSQAVRVLHLLDYLRDVRLGVTLADLAKQFAVSERQVRRDLEAVDEAGHEIEWLTDGTERRVKLVANRQLVRLGIGDRFALLAIRRVFDVLKDTPLYDYVHNVQDRLVNSLPAKDRDEFESFGERFVYVPDGGLKTYKDKSEVIEELLDGVVKRWRVRFRYRGSAGRATEGVMEPWAIALYRQGLYVIAKLADGDNAVRAPAKPRVYAAERFEETEALNGDGFEVPKSFKLDDLFQGAFGLWLGGDKTSHVVVDFEANARPFVEARVWHPSQKLRRLAGGGLRLELDVADTTLVVPWVLSWGALATMRAPLELVERLRRETAAVADAYA